MVTLKRVVCLCDACCGSTLGLYGFLDKYQLLVQDLCVSYIMCSGSGIKSAVVALLAQKAEVNYYSSITNAATIVQDIVDIGFEAEIIEDNAKGHSVLELQVFLAVLIWH